MKSKVVLAIVAVFVMCGAAGLADLFGMSDVSGFLKDKSQEFAVEYHAAKNAVDEQPAE